MSLDQIISSEELDKGYRVLPILLPYISQVSMLGNEITQAIIGVRGDFVTKISARAWTCNWKREREIEGQDIDFTQMYHSCHSTRRYRGCSSDGCHAVTSQ